MRIKILGCHGSDLLDPTQRTAFRSVGFLINESFLIDAGTAASVLPLDAQDRIHTVILTHYHIDHVKELPLLLVNREENSKKSLTVASIEQVLKGLRNNIFNEEIFPNFFELPEPQLPLLRAHALLPNQETQIGELYVTPILVNHAVPCVGYLVRDDRSACVISGDTHQTEAIWGRARDVPNLQGAFIEVSFPDEMQEFAKRTAHLTPTLFAQEFRKIQRPGISLFPYHMKPALRDKILPQLTKQHLPTLHVLQEGEEISL